MKILTGSVDRFFLGKLVSGVLLFLFSCRAALALLVLTGAIARSSHVGHTSPLVALLVSVCVAAVSLCAFVPIERARRRSASDRGLGA